jgi:hypothetical protein
VSAGARRGPSSGKSSKERVIVAGEKADFIADRIEAGVPASEEEIRKLARYLREIAAEMGPGSRKLQPTEPPVDPEATAGTLPGKRF